MSFWNKFAGKRRKSKKAPKKPKQPKKGESKKGPKKAKPTKRVKRTKKRSIKGAPSKTHPLDMDYTTKRGNMYFDRDGHRYMYAQNKNIPGLPYLI